MSRNKAARQRWHRKARQLRDCQRRPKNPYESREEAVADAARVRDESRVVLYPYECACGFWHLTRVPQGSEQLLSGGKQDG